MTRLDTGTSTKILAAVGDAIDNLGGSFTMHYDTLAVVATRAGPS
jgi:hypothetical protein